MAKRNTLSTAPPFEVEQALKTLGANLRTARLARNLSIKAAATKIGVGYRAVATAEAGKATTAIGVYLSLLWAYDLLRHVREVADPARDVWVQRAARARQRAYPTTKDSLDNDF
ncbi:MAG TPA: helix-turn-helix transcriptional regulator [Steroidobacteraceae bacterium]|nr:helix-turn-helix transcriptional regulator [Steroidobacteraceae bacterium]